MGYECWHNYGYGVCIEDIVKKLYNHSMDDVEKVGRLSLVLNLAPEFEKKFYQWVEDCDIERDFNALMGYENDLGYSGLGVILNEVIREHYNLELLLCDDYDGTQYLIFPPIYPWWDYVDISKTCTSEYIDNLFNQITNILYDEDIECLYHSVENGG